MSEEKDIAVQPKRHVHMYVATEVQLLPDFMKYAPEPKVRPSYSPKKNAEAQAADLEKWIAEAPSRPHLGRVARVEARVYDFYTLTSETEFAVPMEDARKLNLKLEVEGTASVALRFLQAVDDWIREDPHYLSPRRVSLRCRPGTETRHLIRYEAMRTGQLYSAGILGALYFAVPTFTWGTLLGPGCEDQHEQMMSQLPLSITESDPTAVELQKTIQLYALGGRIGAV